MVRDDRIADRASRAARREAGDRGDDRVLSTSGRGETFAAVFQRRLSRRGLLKTGAAATLVLAAPPLATTVKPEQADRGLFGPVTAEAAEAVPSAIHFQPIPPQPLTNQEIVVADDHQVAVLLSWGDPIVEGAPAWDAGNQTAAAQEQQVGYNCDFIGWLPLPFASRSSGRGLLWVNHEYTNPELMFAGYDPDNPTEEQVNVELAAHGGSLVELRRESDGRMAVERTSVYNRRVTGTTPIRIAGPAVGHAWLATSDDTTGETVLGMLNNCAGGVTPWGTVLTCEENFHQYFGNLAGLSEDDPRRAVHERYGVPEEASERKWERFHPRFDVAAEPNEPFRFGWVVEVDPYDPASMPVKHTALGRFRHEGATFGYSPTGQVAFYSGDDERFEYVYKYVSDAAFDPTQPGIPQGLLDAGTLYVAKFNDDGTGEWLPLVFGQGPLTEANGFTSQADVLLKTRLAGDAVGATKMDRPEDIQQNPVNKKVYVALTNNTRRTADQVDAANPRPENAYGHIIELTETNDDAASTSFSWDIFILCGDPSDPSTYFAGFPKEMVSPIAAPDNLNFDLDGNLWISTDGQPGTLELADALHVVPTTGPERGRLAQFLSVVYGSECASFDFTRDNRNLFVSVQHPGEGGTFDEPITTWPTSGPAPHPSVIQVWANDRGRVGGGAPAPITNLSFLTTWERTDKPVAELRVSRTWMWGPQANAFEFMEPYIDAPAGLRSVQYFDKSRMEIDDPDGDMNATWHVKNGLLAKELITGRLQLGNDAYEPREPAQINIAGDPNDETGPTYATFNGLTAGAPLAVGTVITQTVGRDGTLGSDDTLATYNVTAAYQVPETSHVVASVFWDFMNSTGLVYENGSYVEAKLFEDPFYATGLPLTEAFWTTVNVAGVRRRVLVQAFERRVLTYTPDNPEGWKVEAGNVGRHYFIWRYGEL